jgi:hypothetical protein
MVQISKDPSMGHPLGFTETAQPLRWRTDDEDAHTGFPIPFTKAEFKQDILETMLILLNQTRFTFFRDSESDAKIWLLLSDRSMQYSSEYASPDNGPTDLGLTFSDIESIEMVQSLVQLYDYGMHGIFDSSLLNIDDSDGSENWTSRILYDLRRSRFLEDWIAYKSGNPEVAVERCLNVAELANARLILEGGKEGFYLGMQTECALDIRQLSLLSGMTEGSIRKRAHLGPKDELKTTKNGVETGIHIQPADAKDWLKCKGRYVPIKKTSARGAEDFTNIKLMSISDFEMAIFERSAYLNILHGADVMESRISKVGVLPTQGIVLSELLRRTFLGDAQLVDVDLMCRLADTLELPKEMFTLRAAEVVAEEKLRNINQLLSQVQESI